MAFTRMTCRACGSTIEPDQAIAKAFTTARAKGERPVASSHASCIYRCACGAGYSNAAAEAGRRLIWREPALNVPEEVRNGLDGVLAGACNVANRTSKRSKFCSEHSEDAITRTVFQALSGMDRLAALAPASPPAGEPSLLLWGAPISGSMSGEAAAALAAVSAALGEDTNRRSEPDAIVIWDSLLVVVEAKFKSSNDLQPDYPHFDRYLDRPELFALPSAAVKKAGWYELARNWRIGTELAERLGRRDFLLVNLGPDELAKTANEFAELLAENPQRRFTHLSWAALLEAAAPLETWLNDYARRHGLMPKIS